MNAKQKMMAEIEGVAVKNGHSLYPWVKGRWGFNTHCRVCAAHVAITVSTKQKREGERLEMPCVAVEVNS